MVAEPSQMIDFLMRTVHKLEAAVAEKDARINSLVAFLESQREFYQDNAEECTRYFDLVDGPREGGE